MLRRRAKPMPPDRYVVHRELVALRAGSLNVDALDGWLRSTVQLKPGDHVVVHIEVEAGEA